MLPVRLARQLRAPADEVREAQASQAEPCPDGRVGVQHVTWFQVVAQGDVDDVERRAHRVEPRDALGEARGQATLVELFGQPQDAGQLLIGPGRGEHRRQGRRHLPHPVGVPGDLRRDVQRRPAGPQQPQRGFLLDEVAVQQRLGGGIGGAHGRARPAAAAPEAVGVHGRPDVGQAEQLPGDDEGPGALDGVRAGQFTQPVEETGADPVDDRVGELGGYDLPPQWVTAEVLPQQLPQRRRQVGVQGGPADRLVGQARLQQRPGDHPLGVGVQDGDLRSGVGASRRKPGVELLGVWQALHIRVDLAGLHQMADEPRQPVRHGHGMPFGRAQRQGLAGGVGQDRSRDVTGGRHQQPLAIGPVDRSLVDGQVKANLDVDLPIGAVHPGGVVHEVGVAASAVHGELDPGGVGEAEVPALGHDPGAQLGRVDPHPVPGLVPDRAVFLRACLDPGADTAVPQQVDRCPQHRPDQGVGGQRVVADPQQLPYLFGQLDLFGRQREHATAGRQHRPVVVVPAAPGQRREAFALGERTGRVGAWVQKYVSMIECGDQPDVAGEEHAVTEDVPGHVTDADDGERFAVGVHAQLGEVTADGFPGTPGGDAQRLVVVPAAATRGEGVAEPVAGRRRHLVGEVGEACGALVRRDHQVAVRLVPADQARPADGDTVDPVVHERQQRPHELRVTGPGQRGQLVGVRRWTPQDEAALGAVRHDDGVLDPLGLHQAENLGAQVLLAVGPPDAAPGQPRPAKMQRVEPPGTDEGLRLGNRRRQPGQPR